MNNNKKHILRTKSAH